MAIELIEQKLEVKDWPLENAGDEKFFGYVMAIGLFPREQGDELIMTQYVDFIDVYTYERYRLPNDKKLIKQLRAVLMSNLDELAEGGNISGKVWIVRGKRGHKVELP